MMKWILEGFDIAARGVDLFALCVLLAGFVRGASGWISLEWRRLPWAERFRPVARLRRVVSTHILFALELLIVSDLIESFLAIAGAEGGEDPFFESEAFYALVQLAMIVAIRTLIERSLSKAAQELPDDAPALAKD